MWTVLLQIPKVKSNKFHIHLFNSKVRNVLFTLLELQPMINILFLKQVAKLIISHLLLTNIFCCKMQLYKPLWEEKKEVSLSEAISFSTLGGCLAATPTSQFHHHHLTHFIMSLSLSHKSMFTNSRPSRSYSTLHYLWTSVDLHCRCGEG